MDHLAAVLLALKLALGRKDRLDELTFRRVFKFEIEAFGPGVSRPQLIAQLEMKDRIARKALEVVENHDVRRLRLGVEKGEQRDHAGPVDEITAARHIIGKHGLDLITLRGGIFPAACFLAIKTVPTLCLLDTGDAAINDGFLNIDTHGGNSLSLDFIFDDFDLDSR